jgi:hypothetical protein
VRAAEAGAAAWRRVVHAQRTATADHGEFYVLAGELVEVLRAVESLAGVLGSQVAGYGTGRALYDDEGHDPGARLADAAAYLDALGERVAQAGRAANGFWSAVGHIAVAVGRGGVAR